MRIESASWLAACLPIIAGSIAFGSLLVIPGDRATADGSASDPVAAKACRADFDGDGETDLAVIVPVGEGIDLFMFLAKDDVAVGRRVFAAHEKMILACRKPDVIKETTAGDYAGRSVRTKNAFVTLRQPEASSFAFFWDGEKFRELVTGD